jgi:hypothetical protein
MLATKKEIRFSQNELLVLSRVFCGYKSPAEAG